MLGDLTDINEADNVDLVIRDFIIRLKSHAIATSQGAPITIPDRGLIEDDADQFALTNAQAGAVEVAIRNVGLSIGLGPNHPLILNASLSIDPFGPGLPTVSGLEESLKDLLALWEQRLREEKPRFRPSGLTIAGGLFVGIMALGAILYAKTKDER